MKKAVLTTGIACFAILFLVIGCKKNSSLSTTDEATLSTQVSQNAVDQTTIENDNDAIATDATKATETVPGFNSSNKVTGLFGSPADSTKDSLSCPWFVIDRSPIAKGFRRMVLRYRGMFETDRNILKRGRITLQLVNGTKWTDVGAVILETDSVAVTRNGNTRIYQGTRYLTNVSGGYFNLKDTAHNPFVFTMHANGSVTFEDGTVRTYWIARRNTFSKAVPYTFTTNGDTTVNASLCTMGGTTRFGKTFLVQSPQAISSSTQFGYAKPTQGVRILNYNGVEPVTIVYGVNALGNQVASGVLPFGYKITWTKLSGQTGEKIISY